MLELRDSMPLVDEEIQRLQELSQGLVVRRMETLRLYRPMPVQEEFHRSIASELVLRGGNRSGKSAAAFMETASCAMNTPLFGADGEPLPLKYSDEPKLIWVIGKGEDHIGDTIHRILFTARSGLRMFRDDKTKEWRAWNPFDPEERLRKSETKPMPPMIPPRAIKHFTWRDKGKKQFYSCELHNGNIIRAFTSIGDPKQGDAVDLIHIDEDIQFPKHYTEWQARISDNAGRIIWSAFPHSANEALLTLKERAKEQLDRPEGKRDVEEFVLIFSDSPFIPEDEKRKRLEAWDREGVTAQRDRGEFQTDDVLMYPSFSLSIHKTPKVEQNEDDQLDDLLRQTGGEIPQDWMRILWLDPGHRQPAVAFFAMPPPRWGDFIVLYDEIYEKYQSADSLARLIKPKIDGQSFEFFGIDGRAGRQTPTGFAMTVQQKYTEAFEKYGIVCASSGSAFVRGSDNVPARTQAVREWLGVRSTGTTKFKIVEERCPWTLREFKLYKKMVANQERIDKPIAKNNNMMNCIEYCAGSNPQYKVPEKTAKQLSYAFRAWQRYEKEAAAGAPEDKSVSCGPVGSNSHVA